jgi:uncharacterized protein YcnI
MTARIAAAGALAAVLIPATAQAHVTVQPNTAEPGAFTVENVRVPNETEDAVTTTVEVQMPPGFVQASYQSTPGWSAKVAKRKLAKPVKTDDGTVTEEVARITWTADKAHGIQPGQFRDFPLSVAMPDKEGALAFKALQTYSNGDVVRWIGPEASDHPAPVVKLAKSENAVAAIAPVKASDDDGGDSGKTLAIIALALAAVALGLSLSGRMRARGAAG